MLPPKETTRISKFLSLVLRHRPEIIGLQLDENGWAGTGALLSKMNENGTKLTPELLQYIVDTNPKKRFAFNEDGTKIRASQGHSIEIDLNLVPQQPPEILYHGTAEKFIPSIMEKGLEKRSRQQVHLSPDITTAKAVGSRHGKPALLVVAAGKMYEAGFSFYCSANGVWLTDNVPVTFLKLL